MIREFKHKGLERFFTRDDPRGCPAHTARIGRILDRLNAAAKPKDMDLPGYRFHRLKGNRANTHSVMVSGNLRITFEWDGEDAVRVNLEDYH
ncbi:MAG: type II toxin-antitoxin system RelE/ParE family toxin [Betaproteobacteria bacterium]|nr:type II toxin-antitoxin system RelE/ParE family toxin [Betaproteobacteria bacterium]MBA3775392.1 type II toxin-antitoxin system RelE/ParE family toxin [Betaproteobacteria bacterium]